MYFYRLDEWRVISLLIVILIASYLIGSIPFGYIISKFKGIDIRQYGSGNIGATNVWRTLGPLYGITVLALDALKGVTGVYLGRGIGVEGLELVAGIATVLGHAYPVFLGFKGGKIIATGLGVLLALTPYVALIALAVFITVILISRYVSLGSIIAALSVPISMFLLKYNLHYIIFGLAICCIAIYRHIPNIKRIVSGTENKINWPKGSRR